MQCKFSFTLIKRILRSSVKSLTRPRLFAKVSLAGLAVTEVNAFSGTAALTDCGVIAVILSTVATDAKSIPNILSETSSLSSQE
jgi:hypothetical protein